MKTKTVLLSLFLSFCVFSVTVSQNQTEWELHKEVNGVQIYAQYVDCNLESEGFFQEYVLLRFVNTTQLPQRISWQLESWYTGPGYEGRCVTCDKEEYRFSLELAAGGTKTGSCDLHSPQKMKVFSKFLNYDTEVGLTKFNIAVIDVSPN